jgi:hypothetical protein
MKYRKKAINVEARQINAANIDQVAEWCGGYVKKRDDNFEPRIEIMTLEGIMTGRLNDWVIKGISGEFYPCKPDIFELTYEKADD